MGTIEKTDAQLVEASRRGELDAFGHLVARYQNMVCAIGYSATGDRGLGEDVAQDTFIAAWRKLDRVRDAMRLGPWLAAIARNLGRKAIRRRRHVPSGDLDDRTSARSSAFDELARGDAERIVRDALQRVPESYREVLVLYYREERSVREVADALGISEDAVMQRLSRGRRYLADGVTALVERSLAGAGARPRRDIAAAVLAAIAILSISPHVDASPNLKGSTMLKLTLAATAIAVVGTTAYLLHAHHGGSVVTAGTKPLLHYGTGAARARALGPTAPRHTTIARTAAANDLGLLPADSDVVFGIDMARIQHSALWQQFVAPSLANATGLHDFVTECGFDPLASLSSVSIGLKGLGVDTDPTGTIVVHGFDKTKAMACFQRVGAAGAEHAGSTVTIDGDVVLIGNPQAPATGYGVGFTFLDNTTALVVIGPALTRAAIEQIAATSSGLQASPAFAELFANINSDDPVWFVVGPSSPLFTAINQSLTPYTAFRVSAAYGSIDITDSLFVQAGARLGTPDQISGLVASLQSELDKLVAAGTLPQYFSQLDVNADGSDVIVSVAANTMQLMRLATTNAFNASATSADSNGPGTFSISATVGTD